MQLVKEKQLSLKYGLHLVKVQLQLTVLILKRGWVDMRPLKKRVRQPLALTKQEASFDIVASTQGGGYSAQADALRHGISKALASMDADFRAILKPFGLLTRDSRIVERKKYGKKKARRSPQFSKR